MLVVVKEGQVGKRSRPLTEEKSQGFQKATQRPRETRKPEKAKGKPSLEVSLQFSKSPLQLGDSCSSSKYVCIHWFSKKRGNNTEVRGEKRNMRFLESQVETRRPRNPEKAQKPHQLSHPTLVRHKAADMVDVCLIGLLHHELPTQDCSKRNHFKPLPIVECVWLDPYTPSSCQPVSGARTSIFLKNAQ